MAIHNGTHPPSATRSVDPRRFLDKGGKTPFMRARLLNHVGLVSLLNPFTPLERIFDSMAVRVIRESECDPRE